MAIVATSDSGFGSEAWRDGTPVAASGETPGMPAAVRTRKPSPVSHVHHRDLFVIRDFWAGVQEVTCW